MYYGFDVGGTKIEFGAFNQQLERVATERVPTPTEDYDLLVSTLANLVEKYDQQFATKGSVGLGFPGMEDADTGAVLTVNVPAAKGKTLRKDLEAKIQRPVKVENDANCFALSEAWDDSLQSEPSVLGLILGTGFGGGLVVGGEVFSGRNNVAGEVGHQRLPIDAWFLLGDSGSAPLFQCGCDKKGCLDNYLSGRGFEQLYAHYYSEPKKALDIIADYHNGESRALEFVDKFMELLAICLGGLLTSIDPHVVVLGGGLSNFELIYEELPKRLPKYLLSVAKAPQIVKAKHGDSGGVRGAAFLNIKQ